MKQTRACMEQVEFSVIQLKHSPNIQEFFIKKKKKIKEIKNLYHDNKV